ncbi:TRAP transporter substrate-binding protein DctP [Peptococcaceae bacterium]|nr:TRAP transporter substrate-binding protein DctP [Peptococcaceae bacterium]
MFTKRKVSLFCVVLVVSVFLLAGCQEEQAQISETPTEAEPKEVIRWKMASTWTPVMPQADVDKFFIEQVEKLTNGRLQIDYYSAGELMPAFQVFDAARAGTIQMASELACYWAGKDSAFEAIGISPMGMGYDEYMIWLYGKGGIDLVREIYAEYGLYYIPIGVISNNSGIHGNEPIRTLEDFEGLKIRTPAPILVWLFEQLGATGTIMPGGEVYMALQLGTIDAAEFLSQGTNYLLRWHEVTEYWNAPAGWFTPGELRGIAINMDAWNALPDDIKVALETAGKATWVKSRAYNRMKDIEATERLINEYNQEVVFLEDEALAEIERLIMKYHEMRSAENPKYAKVIRSQMDFLKRYSKVREIEGPFSYGRNLNIYPNVK